MISFSVDDMTCDHCVRAITDAVLQADPTATLRVDLARHRVHIQTSAVDAGTLRAAIEAAGYAPLPVSA